MSRFLPCMEMLLVIFKVKTKGLLGQNPADSKPLLGTSTILNSVRACARGTLAEGREAVHSALFHSAPQCSSPIILVHYTVAGPGMGWPVSQSHGSLLSFSTAVLLPM